MGVLRGAGIRHSPRRIRTQRGTTSYTRYTTCIHTYGRGVARDPFEADHRGQDSVLQADFFAEATLDGRYNKVHYAHEINRSSRRVPFGLSFRSLRGTISYKTSVLQGRISDDGGPREVFSLSGRTYQNGTGLTPDRQRTALGAQYFEDVSLDIYGETVLDADGMETRERKQFVLVPVRVLDGFEPNVSRRGAKRLLPYVDLANLAISDVTRGRSATFEAFAGTWERDYLSQAKPATQSSTRSCLKRLKAEFGRKEMWQIDAGDIQRMIANLSAQGLTAKTIRNIWGVTSLIWNAALSQRYVDAMLPKPKLPRKRKRRPVLFTLEEVSKIIAASQDEHRALYWLLAETGLRAGEIAGLRLTDIDSGVLTVNRSVWNGSEQSPKSDSALRKVALSPQLIALVSPQLARQKAKRRAYLFSASNGSPLDMNLYRQRKLRPLLRCLDIQQVDGKSFHAFRHFNVSLLDTLRVPLKVIQERIGHALTGSFTLDVYGSVLDERANKEAALKAGSAISKAVQKAVKAERRSREE